MSRTNFYPSLLWAAFLLLSACSEYDPSQDQREPSLLMATATSDVILLQFDEAIEASSLSYQSFTLHDDMQREMTREGQFYLFDEFIELRAKQMWQSGKGYRVTLSGLTDRAGNLLPKMAVDVVPVATVLNGVVALDQRAPLLLSHLPEANSDSVELNQSLILNFSEPMDCASLQGALTLSGVETELRFCQESRAVYQPLEPLQGESSYEVVLLGATDLAGNLLPFISWNFSTTTQLPAVDLPVLDIKPPEVVALLPEDGRSEVDHNLIAVVYFDERIECATARLEFDDLSVLGTVSCEGRQIHFSPETEWDEGSFYSLRLSGVQDLAGNVMDGVLTWSFSTH